MQYYSTAGIPSKQKLVFWNDVSGDALTEMEIRPRPGCTEFEGTLYRDDFGPIGIGRASSTPAQITRTAAQIARASERLFLVNFCHRGRFTMAQGGREATVEEGDFTITDSGEPFVMTHHTACDAVVLRVPDRLMRAYIPMPEDLVGRAISGQRGLSAVASSMIRAIGLQMQGELAGERESHVGAAVLEIIAGACASALDCRVGETAAAGIRRVKMRRFIEAGLRNPDMTPGAVAAAFGISERYVRAVFAAEGETVSAYILRRRLEECARRLRDPLWRGRTISDIAFEWGFNSLGSFCRAFKSRYGTTPHEFRSCEQTLPLMRNR